MPRRAKGVTAAQVDKGTKPGRYGDGAGLYLLVRSRKAKFWLFRYTHARDGKMKMREMGLGPATGRAAVSLVQARDKARELHQAVREGRDPLDERDADATKAKADAAKVQAGAMTFAQVADMYVAAHEASWRSERHRQQWHNSLRDYMLPALGAMAVADITTAEVMRVLEQAAAGASQGAARRASRSTVLARSRRVHAAGASGHKHRRPLSGISDFDRLSQWRSARGDVVGDRPRSRGVDDPRGAHQGRARASRAVVRAGAGGAA
jgi:hypothetical protein